MYAFRNWRWLLLAVGLFWPYSPGNAEVVERIAAIVNDEIILWSEVMREAEAWRGMLVGIRDPGKLMAKKKEVHHKVLDSLVEDLLLYQQIKELGMKVSEVEVDNAIKNVMDKNNIPDEATLKTALKQQGIEWKDYRESVTKQLNKWQFINAKVGSRVKISDEEVRDQYEKEMVSQVREYEYRASHILFRVAKTDKAEKTADQKERAERALVRARAGEDFAALARELSEGPTARHGGDLGYFQKGVMVRDFEHAVIQLETGEVSGVVRTPFGFHVVKLEDKRPVSVTTFEESKEKIRGRLREEEMQRQMVIWLKELRRKAFVRVLIDEEPKQVIPARKNGGTAKEESR